MITVRPKCPTDFYGTIYIDHIQKAVVICLSFLQYFLLMMYDVRCSLLVFSGVRVTRSCLSFCTFSFGHCVVCFRLRHTDSDYPLESSNFSQVRQINAKFATSSTQLENSFCVCYGHHLDMPNSISNSHHPWDNLKVQVQA